MKARIYYIDAIKAVLMFLVVWGHVIQYTNVKEGLDNCMAAFIYSFHMPMFMMLSGMFFNKQLKNECSQMLLKNILRLLLPAFVITFCLFLLVYVNKPRGLEESISWFWHCRPWFVTILFFCNITTFLIHKVIRHKGFTFILTFLFFCMIPDISCRILFMYPFFVLGYYINSPYIGKTLINSAMGGVTVVFFVLCISLKMNTSDITIYSSPYVLWSINDGLHIDSTLITAIKRYIIGFCGSVSVFYMLKRYFCGIGQKIGKSHILQYIGRQTLGLYLFQIAFITMYMGVKNDFTENLTYGKDWLAFILSIVLLISLLVIIKLVRKSRCAKMLLLGEITT